jgi:hypothetical protein
VPEDVNIEVARSLHEKGVEEAAEASAKHRSERTIEILEAVLLAIVAIATAWSGYQAAKWDGVNAQDYGLASKYRAEANQAWTLGGQQRLFDASNFSVWLEAENAGNKQIANLYARRFSPEYEVAFRAWVAAGGLTDPSVPPGPSYMPQYHNHLWERAAALERQATATFTEGTLDRKHGDDFVRVTVLFATVLFLVAVGQRFKIRGPRLALMGVSFFLLIVALFFVATYPVAP